MPDCTDASSDRHEEGSSDPSVDATTRDALFDQLAARDDAMLTSGEVAHEVLERMWVDFPPLRGANSTHIGLRGVHRSSVTA
ncbi:MAG: hypothetical protein JWL76_1795 [Thermoleophilia bacterium]|nr:hypothetical protein [Thermoleophilia bacterium]